MRAGHSRMAGRPVALLLGGLGAYLLLSETGSRRDGRCERMVWSGGMPLGLFKGERTYTLTRRGDLEVEFTMREIFSGPMAPLVTRAIPDLKPSFDEFAAALKSAAEARA